MIKPIKKTIASGCNRAVLGIVPVLTDEITLLKTISPNEIKPTFDPKIALMNGATPLRNKIRIAINVPKMDPKAFQRDFR
jgi:hypothetical protein